MCFPPWNVIGKGTLTGKKNSRGCYTVVDGRLPCLNNITPETSSTERGEIFVGLVAAAHLPARIPALSQLALNSRAYRVTLTEA